MSWACAHVSINRAVTEDATPMSGPYQGSRAAGSTSRVARHERVSARPEPVQQLLTGQPTVVGGDPVGEVVTAAVNSAASRRNRSGSTRDSSVASSK